MPNEGFTFGYDLPNETAYAETCASIALVFWAKSMFDIDPDSRYTNVMERSLYMGARLASPTRAIGVLLRQPADVVPLRQPARALQRHQHRPPLPPRRLVRVPVLPAQPGPRRGQRRRLLPVAQRRYNLRAPLQPEPHARDVAAARSASSRRRTTPGPATSSSPCTSTSRCPLSWRCASPTGALISACASTARWSMPTFRRATPSWIASGTAAIAWNCRWPCR